MNFICLSSPFNSIFQNIGLVFAKSLYTSSFPTAFSIPLSNKIFIFSKKIQVVLENSCGKQPDLKCTFIWNHDFYTGLFWKHHMKWSFRTGLAFCIWLKRPKLSFPWHICKRQHLKNKLSLQAIEIKHSDLIQSTVQLVPWDEDSWIFSNGKMKSDQACLLSFTKYNYANYKAPL